MTDRDPGLPLRTLSGQVRCVGIRFDCMACRKFFDLAFDVVVSDLERRRVGGWETRIRDVAGLARKPCVRCGALKYETMPAWS
jgi:hypothetical protein